MKIRSKQSFLKLWEKGELGNKTHTWLTIKEAEQSGFPNEVALRYAGKLNGAPLVAGLRVTNLREAMEKLRRQGWQEHDYYVIEALPPPLYVINGEVGEVGELVLTYSTVPGMMRDSFREGIRYTHGLTAKLILRHLLDPIDYDSLFALLDQYPEHVVEFSGFTKKVGILRRRMIIWEVRLY